MPSEVTHYFDIEGMTCGTCSNAIETVLIDQKCIRDVDINLATHKARVVAAETTKPKDIINIIQSIGFDAKWVSPDNEKKVYFSLKGLRNINEANAISDALMEKNKSAYIKSVDITFSTSSASIVCLGGNDKQSQKIVTDQIKKDIFLAAKNPKLKVENINTPINKVDTRTLTKHYYRKAQVNALFGIPYWLCMYFALIPLPITLVGQGVGIGIGLATFAIMWATGKEFYKDAWKELIKNRSSNMNTLIALGTGSAWVYSMVLVLFPTLFPAVALQYQFLAVNMILGIVNFGKGIRSYAQERTKRMVQDLAQVYVKLQPQIARKLNFKYSKDLLQNKNLDKHISLINYRHIKEGDILQVKPGERFPVEGTILNDVETAVNQETLTGESRLRYKRKGDEVYSGSLNNKKMVYIRANRNGTEGHLTRIIKDVDKSSSSKSTISKVIDKLAKNFTPTIVVVAIVSAIAWFVIGPVPALPWIIKSFMSVLLCACPCALILATPISTTLAMYKLFNKGILVHDATALEAAARLDTVVFDKTGTITRAGVGNIFVTQKNWPVDKVLRFVRSLEHACIKKGYNSPIAKSFLTEINLYAYKTKQKASGPKLRKGSSKGITLFGTESHLENKGIPIPSEDPLSVSTQLSPCQDVKKEEQGVSGIVGDRIILAGTLSHLESKGIKVPPHFKVQENKNSKDGMTSIYVAIKNKAKKSEAKGMVVAVVGLEHEIREDAKRVISQLQDMDIEVMMLTGDKKEPAQAVAKKVGITKIYSECDSLKKERLIKKWKQNRNLAMMADGVNDFRAVKAADVGIAVGSWTDASSAAHVALQDINLIPLIIISKETMKNIYQNLRLSFVYNLISLAVATGLIYPLLGVVMNPILASALMGFSSLFVVLNSSKLLYEIDDAMDIYEGRRSKPKTRLERIKQKLSLRNYWLAFKSIFFFDEATKAIPQKPTSKDVEFVKMKKVQSPKRPKANSTIKFNLESESKKIAKKIRDEELNTDELADNLLRESRNRRQVITV